MDVRLMGQPDQNCYVVDPKSENGIHVERNSHVFTFLTHQGLDRVLKLHGRNP